MDQSRYRIGKRIDHPPEVVFDHVEDCRELRKHDDLTILGSKLDEQLVQYYHLATRRQEGTSNVSVW
jgi:hypothetical protein